MSSIKPHRNMRWYGSTSDGKEIFVGPDGRRIVVTSAGTQNDSQKLAFQAWQKGLK